MNRYTLKVTLEGTAFDVEAMTEEEAKSIVYDWCKNHDLLVVDTIESEVIAEEIGEGEDE